ncbi:MAG: DNA internalization-related competence protein ComEC/Rec2 [Thermoanaerobacteraceae bacterium]|nr:DNA internalization-related competence protein ComEC/Rec2 [Thermoanaerobacteraceae bacterium]
MVGVIERRPLVFAAGCMLLGMALAPLADVKFLAVGLALILLPAVYPIQKYLKISLVQVSMLLGFFVIGLLWVQLALHTSPVTSSFAGQKVTLMGKVIKSTEYDNRDEIVLKAGQLQAAGTRILLNEKVLVVFYNRRRAYLPGDRVKVTGKVILPTSGGNIGEFNYRAYLRRQGIFSRLVAEDSELMQTGGFSFSRVTAMFKRQTVNNFFRVLTGKQAAVVTGVLLGDKQYLERKHEELYKDLGVMHVFAVSGMHVGFVASAILGLCHVMRLPGAPRFFLTVCGLVLYAGLAGFSASVVRATIMTAVGLGAYFVDRRKDFYNALALAALAWLVWHPLALFDAGFQLSFAAAFSIYYLYPLGDRLLSFLPSWRGVIIVPLAAQVGLLPLLAYHFGSVSPLGLLANIPVVFAAGIIVLLGLVVLMAQFIFWPVAELLLYSLGLLVTVINTYLSLLGQLPLAVVYVKMPSLITILVYYAALIFVRESLVGNVTWLSKWKQLPAAKLAFAVLAAILLMANMFPQSRLQVVFLDVGQGDAALITMPGGKHVLVDAAGGGYGDFEVGRDRLVPALQRLGVRKIDLFINSHPDRDHVGGIFAVVAALPIELAVLPPITDATEEEYKPILDLFREKNIPYRHLARGDSIRLSREELLIVLNPPDPVPGGWDDNDQSLVVMLVYKHHRFLFTGDIEQEAISFLLSSNMNLAASVVKVPHHGSAGSFAEAFYRQVNPKIAVISVGRNNFGHPASSVLSYFKKRGIDVYRTDKHGAITVTSDGNRLWVRTQ